MAQLGTKVTRTSDPTSGMNDAQRRVFWAIQHQKRVTSYRYYSTVNFEAVAVPGGGAASTYTIPASGERRAFSYAVGDPMTSAGYAVAAGNATIAETNLTKRNETTGGQNVLIHGVAIQLKPGSVDGTRSADARTAEQIFSNCSVQLSLNGDSNLFRMGTPAMIPGAGGLSGSGDDTIGFQPLDGGRPHKSQLTNGWAVRSNYFPIAKPGLVWRHVGKSDAQLNLIITPQRALVMNTGGTLENTAGTEAAAAGIRGFVYPPIVQVQLLVHLIGEVVGPRSNAA